MSYYLNFAHIMHRCNKDQASVLLVNNDSSDQYLCSSVPTVPDDTPQMSTCSIKKSEMSSGNWSILLLGNNGIGDPFAWQRDFHLFVAVPQTVTTTSTVIVTVTTTPVVVPSSKFTLEGMPTVD